MNTFPESKAAATKALSIRQPWAWLIVNGFKDVENRSWTTSFRGMFFVHASKKIEKEAYEWVRTRFDIAIPEPSVIKTGGIVGIVRLIDCVDQYQSKWFTGPYGFVLKDAQPLQFKPLSGRLGFFNIEG